MIALLSPKLWAAIALAVALAATGWKGYVMGKTGVQAEWDKVELRRQAEATKFSEAARAKELALNAENRRISDDLQKAKLARAAADQRAADSLRDFTSAIGRTASQDTGSTFGTDDTYRTIASECGIALKTLDGYASSLAEKARGLQGYAELCLR